MSDPAIREVTRLLADRTNGNEYALDDLTPLVYQELRRLAASYLRKERHGHTLQPTAVVHGAYLSAWLGVPSVNTCVTTRCG